MGRGASDLTAVALAAALDAEVCEIYTDVEGVYSADPRIVPKARKLSRVSFDEMLEMAATGGRVLALRSVEFARNHHVQVHVRSSFTWAPGTWVTEEDPSLTSMEQAIHLGRHARRVRGQGHDRAGSRPARRRGHVVPRARRRGRERRHDRAERVDRRPHRHLVHRSRAPISRAPSRAWTRSSSRPRRPATAPTRSIGRVSLIGAGMKTNPGIAAQMFEVLAAEGINIEMISTSTIRISCVVAEDDVEPAVRALHTAFGLDGAS